MGEPDTTFAREAEAHYVASVRAAASATFEQAKGQPHDRVYVLLAQELEARGVEPEPAAVYDGALLISRGDAPAVLRSAGRRRRVTTETPQYR